MRRLGLVVLVVVALGACAWGYKLYMLSVLRTPVLAQLADPDSAQFRNESIRGEWWHAKGSILCGEVNAKNKMGGYVGYKPFTSFGGLYADVATSDVMAEVVEAQCSV